MSSIIPVINPTVENVAQSVAISKEPSIPSGLVLNPPVMTGVGTFPVGVATATLTITPTTNDNPDATYKIYRDSLFLEDVAATGLEVNHVVNTGMVADTSYEFRVNVVDDQGFASRLSAQVNVAIPTLLLIPAPTAVTAIQSTLTDVQVSFTPTAGGTFPVDFYNIYRATVVNGTPTPFSLVGTTAASPHIDTPAFSVYQYIVAPVDTDGNEGILSAADEVEFGVFNMMITVAAIAGNAGYLAGSVGALVPDNFFGVTFDQHFGSFGPNFFRCDVDQRFSGLNTVWLTLPTIGADSEPLNFDNSSSPFRYHGNVFNAQALMIAEIGNTLAVTIKLFDS